MVIGCLAFGILVVLLMKADRAEHHAIFYPRLCGYCDMGVSLTAGPRSGATTTAPGAASPTPITRRSVTRPTRAGCCPKPP